MIKLLQNKFEELISSKKELNQTLSYYESDSLTNIYYFLLVILYFLPWFYSTMQCPNKFLISATPYSLMNFPDFQTKSSSFYPLNRTQKMHHGPKANHRIYGENASEKMLPFPPKVKSITSTSNPFVKHCVKLQQSSSYRHFHGSVLVVGAILVRCLFLPVFLLSSGLYLIFILERWWTF